MPHRLSAGGCHIYWEGEEEGGGGGGGEQSNNKTVSVTAVVVHASPHSTHTSHVVVYEN